jgi:hypothetical protein
MGTSSPNKKIAPNPPWRSRLLAGWSSPWATTALLTICLLLLSLQFWHLSLFGSSVDYEHAGTWGDMISGVASAFAVIVAVGSVAAEQRRSAEERLKARVQELTSVYCWLEWGVSDGTHTWIIRFQNETRVPILRWQVRMSPVSGSQSAALIFASSALGPIRPGSSEILIDELSGTAPEFQPSLDFAFMDPSSAYWRRSADATLTSLKALEILLRQALGS